MAKIVIEAAQIKTKTIIRECYGNNSTLVVVETDDYNSHGEIADQFIALGEWLRDNPDLDISAVNYVYMETGPDYLAVAVNKRNGAKLETAVYGD